MCLCVCGGSERYRIPLKPGLRCQFPEMTIEFIRKTADNVLTAEELLCMLLLHQQSCKKQTLKTAACLSLPAQALSFASQQGCSVGILCKSWHSSSPVLCSQAGLGAAEANLSGGGRRQMPRQRRACCGLKSYCQSMCGNKEISSSFWCSFLQGLAVVTGCRAVDGDGNGRLTC